MKPIYAILLFGVLMSSGLAAQEKGKSEEKAETKESESKRDRELIPVRVQVVISEYDGEKKISSLPYALLLNAPYSGRGERPSSIRMGLKVPIAVSANNIQYQDLGTNLDGWASRSEDGRFVLQLNVERSSTYASSATNGQSVPTRDGNQPVIQSFRTHLELLIRDGQTIQSTVATDPISGRVSKVDVTLNLAK